MMSNIVLFQVIQILKFYEIEMILWNNILIKKIVLMYFINLMNLFIIIKELNHFKIIKKNFQIFHQLLNI